MTVKEIVARHLQEIGADGLCADGPQANPHDKCSCSGTELFACIEIGEDPSDCVPGWKGFDCDTGGEMMFPSKEAADRSWAEWAEKQKERGE